MDHKILKAILTLIFTSALVAQTPTVGMIRHDPQAYEGYTLFAPLTDTVAYLIDNDGNLVHQWIGHFAPGNSVYLLDDASLLRTCNVNNPKFSGGGSGGRVQRISWDGTMQWNYRLSDASVCQHHDVEYLPNGNILMIAWEYKSKAEAVQAGRNPQFAGEDGLWCDFIAEVKPKGIAGGEIVWTWHVWDHLIQDFDAAKDNYGVVADHPELIDINFVRQNPDWNHINAIDYNDSLNQIILSVREFSEIWIIEHTATSGIAEAHTDGVYGKGGDLLYRWGNPAAYDMGTAFDQKLYHQHDAQWIADSLPGAHHILVYNNGDQRPAGEYSTIEEIAPPADYLRTPASAFGPTETVWTYQADPDTSFFSGHISGCQRQPNGNTLICEGAYGRFFEVTEAGEIVWEYINPVTALGILDQGQSPMITSQGTNNSVFRAYRYGPDVPAFAGKTLTPGDPIENYPNAVDVASGSKITSFQLHGNYPNPFNQFTVISFSVPDRTRSGQLSEGARVKGKVFDIRGHEVMTIVDRFQSAGLHDVRLNTTHLSSGLYVYRLTVQNQSQIGRMLLIK